MRRKDLRKPFPRNLKKIVDGSKVTHIARRAKYILIHLNNQYVLVIHLGMSGRIVFYPRAYKPQTHDHFILHLKNGQQIVFNDPRRFGLVDLVHEDAMESHALFSHLGPEPLGNGFSGPVLADAIKGKKVAIKNAIMDQCVVVGVGNIYASEALFMAGIDPKKPAGRVRGEKADALAQAIKKVLRAAVKAGGSTLRDHRQTNGELGYFQHRFAVYGREGHPCPGCSCGIQRIVQGGRATFYCATCQK